MKKITILTGAGISAESGISTFRDQNGLWENHSIEDVATYEGFLENPELVHKFYNQRRSQLLHEAIKPNAAHFALAKLESDHQFNVNLITQNVDNLHERAGHEKVIHMHGELMKIRCEKSGQVFFNQENIGLETICDCCHTKGNLRPHIVWFGEVPLKIIDIYSLVKSSDLFLSIGTSGLVYPAAGLSSEAKAHGAKCIEINLEDTPGSQSIFDESIKGKASIEVPQFIDQLINGNFPF